MRILLVINLLIYFCFSNTFSNELSLKVDKQLQDTIDEIGCEMIPDVISGDWRINFCKGRKSTNQEEYKKALDFFEKSCNDSKEEGKYGCIALALTYKKLNYSLDKIVNTYREACDKNELSACLWMGCHYDKKEKINEAKRYFKKVCDKKESKSRKFSSLWFVKSLDFSKDIIAQGCFALAEIQNISNQSQDAIKNYETAYKLANHPEACYKLGQFYKKGKNIKRDYTEALRLFEEACEYEHGRACYEAGKMYANALGTAKDDQETKKFHEKACEYGVGEACSAIEKNEKACENKDGKACYKMAQDHEDSEGKQTYYRKACDLNYYDGCKKLGLIYENKQDFQRAMNIYQRDKKSKILFQDRIGFIYLKMDNKEEAKPYLENACLEDNNEACFELADITKDNNQKKIHLDKACNLKNAEACYKLGEILLDQCPSQALSKFEKSCNFSEGSSKSCLQAIKLYTANPENDLSSDKFTRLFTQACKKEKKEKETKELESFACSIKDIPLNIEKLSNDKLEDIQEILKKECFNKEALNHSFACYKLGEIEQDETKQLNYYKKSCDEYQYAYACKTIGDLYDFQNKDQESNQYLQKACEFGLKKSCKKTP